MARKSGSTILQEELYPPSAEAVRQGLHDRSKYDLEMDDARLIDLDVDEESPFLRGQKRVSARRSPLPKKAISGLKWTAIILFALCLASIAGGTVYQYGERNWRFRIESSDDIQISGTHNVPHAQVIEVLGGDIGRNIFFIPLAERKAQLEKIPWVESASVMRFVPNRLVVEIHERTPIAFARLGSRISLIDAGGTLMELPVTSKQKYSFPVVVGMNPGEPLSTRTARMKIYNDLVRQLDADGGHYSQDLSEADVSDPEDVKVLANDPAGAVLVHLGSSDYLTRYKVYVSHVRGWRQQFDKLESVDLRYDHQIIVNPDQQGTAKAPPLTPAAAKAAMAAGVKRAALIHVVNTGKPFGPQALKPPAKQLVATTKIAQPAPTVDKPKPAAKPAKRVARRRRGARKAVAKGAKAETVKPQAKAVPEASDAGKTAASKDTSAANAKAKHPAAKKPSAAIAKNQEQQDHP